MKRITLITLVLGTLAVLAISSCDSKRQPGKIYMPDMAYSRAYETYAQRNDSVFSMNEADRGKRIFYNAMPVPGTMKRNEELPFAVKPANMNGVDSNALMVQTANISNPIPALSKPDSLEASRLFNINCAVCHGAKGEANGPLAAKVGGVKSIVAGAPNYSDGRIFYIMTYGQNNMGSYASQLDRHQRWMIVHYIRSLQPKAAAATANAAPAKDSTKTK
jgi:mono/diheme cytochrome c family protein